MSSFNAVFGVPIFAGQGTSSAKSEAVRIQAISDSSTSSGSLLLSTCHSAFHSEISSLSQLELAGIDIHVVDFELPTSLLPTCIPRYKHNALLSGVSIFLTQALRYLVFAESRTAAQKSGTSFTDVAQESIATKIGVLGFSSGILPACLVSSTTSVLSYISCAVEIFRLAVWIGIRCQIYRVSALNEACLISHSAPWSYVFHGLTRPRAQEAINEFGKMNPSFPPLYLTAVMDATWVTISGRPDGLAVFSRSFTDAVAVHPTTMDTLYHAPVHAEGVREQLLADVTRRSIAFPEFNDLIRPLYSTIDGSLITCNMKSGRLVELVLDMLLTEPISWDFVLQELFTDILQSEVPIRLLNFGPGMGIARGVERALSNKRILCEDYSGTAGVRVAKASTKQEPIAIVGMAINMPGAPNVSELWKVLEQGLNTISEIPEHRFLVANYDGQNPKRQMNARTGNFIDDADKFDNIFFKISPREAKSMDPQQRILLHTAYEALEDAGYLPDSTPTFQTETFGCFIGAATSDYVQNLRSDIDAYYSSGTLKAFLSGRISYLFGFSGPSIVVDTACSSSCVAIYQAARSLMNHDCNAALVGGVNIISSPDMFLGLDRGHFLSPSGQCKTFDLDADGYSRSEGCGVFILKRLEDAVTENDNILGVIRGVEVNQSGLARSITHPHSQTQSALFQKLLNSAGVDANSVNVIEAHGTGTQAGDICELESIRRVFAQGRRFDNPLHITSVKGNIGHLESASGSAGLAKLLLMLQHKSIPRQISLSHLNSQVAPLSSDNTVIDTEQVDWMSPHSNKPRIAVLNNFGAAGSNAALMLQEFPKRAIDIEDMPFVFGMSAKTESSLIELRDRYIAWLLSDNLQSISFVDLAYTATARRQVYQYRSAVSASTQADLIQKLRSAPIVTRSASSTSSAVIFAFSGQGGQYMGMGSSLYRTSPVFKQHINECQAILVASGYPGIIDIISPSSASSGLSSEEELQAYQSATFALEYSLAKMWMAWGLMPSAVMGHSLGEYAALVVASVLSISSAVLIVAERARLMITHCHPQSTGMLAVGLAAPLVAIELDLSQRFLSLSISCYNERNGCVLSGPLEILSKFQSHLTATFQCKCVMLSVPFGYHSSAMLPILDKLTAFASQFPINPPNLPIVSNVHGAVIMPGDDIAFNKEYFSLHCIQPVRFEDGTHSLHSLTSMEDMAIWVEIGPHTSLLPILKSELDASPGLLLLGSLRKSQDPWATLMESLSRLFVCSDIIRWREIFSHISEVKCARIPNYPFSRKSFWVTYTETDILPLPETFTSPMESLADQSSLLNNWAQFPSIENDLVAVFETPISQLSNLIMGHKVGGMPLCPASIYLEQALAGIHLCARHLGYYGISGSLVILKATEFVKPMVYDKSVPRVVKVSVSFRDGHGSFTISSRVNPSGEEAVHVRGDYEYSPQMKCTSKLARRLPVVGRHIRHVMSHNHRETFSTRTVYDVMLSRVVQYATDYHTVQSISVHLDSVAAEACATVKLPADHIHGKYEVHPLFMDTLLHVAGFVSNMQGSANEVFICAEIQSVRIIPELIDNTATYWVYCSTTYLAEEGIIIADLSAVRAGTPERLVATIKCVKFRRIALDKLKKSLTLAVGKTPPFTSRRNTTAAVCPFQPRTIVPKSLPTIPVDCMNTSSNVLRIVAEACDISTAAINLNSDLLSLGVDSLMFIEIIEQLKLSLPGIHLSAHSLSSCTTPLDIVRELDDILRAQSPCSTPPSSPESRALSNVSSPRTLVSDDKLTEPPSFLIDGEPSYFMSLNQKLSPASPADLFLKYEPGEAVQKHKYRHFAANDVKHQPGNQELFADKQMLTLDNVPALEDTANRLLRLESNPILIQERPDSSYGTPLFLIHDGSGLVNYYDRLPCLDRSVYAIRNPLFQEGTSFTDITDMAKTYAEYVLSVSSGPLILGGWSFGGVVAYEIAQLLINTGVSVQGILLIDAPSPIHHVPISEHVALTALHFHPKIESSRTANLITKQFLLNSALLGLYRPRPKLGDCSRIVILRSSDPFSPSGVDVPDWLSRRNVPSTAKSGWDTLTTEHICVLDIPGHHFQAFHKSNVKSLAEQMKLGCEYLESFDV